MGAWPHTVQMDKRTYTQPRHLLVKQADQFHHQLSMDLTLLPKAQRANGWGLHTANCERKYTHLFIACPRFGTKLHPFNKYLTSSADYFS